ncbi:hypothetical protein AHF37_05111 [Paragonimus kellicotti]|nr:hypothetical protein AHF37_05111 [Paragonimus kellicotti]
MNQATVQSQACRTPEERLGALMDFANKIDFVHGLDIQQYFRFMRAMVSMVDTYVRTKQKESAYVLASKFAILYLQHLPKHREYASINPAEKTAWNTRCKTLLNKAEQLKSELYSLYEIEHKQFLEAEKAREVEEANRAAEEETRQSEAAAKARIQQEKRASVLGTLVPKSCSMKSLDGGSPKRLSSPILPGYPTLEQPPGETTSLVLIPPPIDRSVKPATTKTNEYGWSTVRISPLLIQRFLQLAQKNTSDNRETCGILCGRVSGNEFQITDLVLPKQSGTSDSCATYKEEELFEYTEKHGLLVLGWIHTHPSQTAFLSSVDQHTQLSYQIMLPEAIAIVCAPKFNEIKTFSLTPAHGIPLIRQCKQLGFHPHTQTAPIYEPSEHVVYDEKLVFSVLDLR